MSLFGDLTKLNPFQFRNSGYTSSSVTSSLSILNNEWILYVCVAVFIVIVLFMLMGRTIDMSWTKYIDPRPANWKINQRAKLFFPPGPQFSNMIVTVDKSLQGMEDDIYSMIFDFVLYESRNYRSTESPYRHILHRGSNELTKATVGGALLGGCSTNPSGELPPFGLPKRLNPGVFLDPNTNDILIFVDTIKGSETFRESLRVVDIPLDTPIRIGIVINKRVLEVYINCRLESTKVLQGDPKLVENEWYAIAGPEGTKAQLQNLYVWKESLSSDDMKSLCPGPPTFSKLRPICSSADEPLDNGRNSSKKIPAHVSLGIASSLSTCGK